MTTLSKGRYRAWLAHEAADIRRAQDLRGLAFRSDGARDADEFDAFCSHVLIEETGGDLVCCFRFLPLAKGRDIHRSYASQVYDLSKLEAFDGAMMEIGRFCLHPDCTDPDILRLAWGMIAAQVDAGGVKMLFGCSSFPGTDPAPYAAAFALLQARHLGPDRWRPGIGASDVVRFSDLPDRAAPGRAALSAIPPLLRTYLMMGGWVSDHAVVDTEMNTLHVFTGVEVAAIPPERKRLLRALAG
ncbi:GNAT family N-acetyltransferase [Pacificoceanicola onchidii]|uniref:GNAT family N-acetyltransferase n=1 Tax=Pacificoceanicola onchidii TaxID=2562685 RepID=UPI0010A49B64|nr:GNAT family N-acyltransferase [Pacificoceanicola onchidii]